MDAQAHLGRACPHAELVEQPPQVRVRAVVVDDETGVDREQSAGRVGDVVGVGMATEAFVGLVEGHLARAGQDVGSGQAGNPGADDGDSATIAGRGGRHDRLPAAGNPAAQIRPQPAATAITFAREDGGTDTPKPIASPASHATLAVRAARSGAPGGASNMAPPEMMSLAPIAHPRFLVAREAGRAGVSRPAVRASECGRTTVYVPYAAVSAPRARGTNVDRMFVFLSHALVTQSLSRVCLDNISPIGECHNLCQGSVECCPWNLSSRRTCCASAN